MKQNRMFLCFLLFLMVLSMHVPILSAQQRLSEMSEEERNKKVKEAIEQHRKEKEKTKHPKVDQILTELEYEYDRGANEAAAKFNAGEALKDDSGNAITNLEDAKKKGGGDAAKEFVKKRGREVKSGNKIEVEITLEVGTSGEAFDGTKFESYGGEIISRYSGNYIWADIPINRIRKIADEVEGIIYIRAPISIPTPDSYRSEGLSKVGFSSYSSAGIRGAGVKVAIIDVEFGGISNAISNGDLPSNVTKVDCTGSSCVSTSFSSESVTGVHGTAVAEIVHDMAPDAQLYLIKTKSADRDAKTLKNAVTYCKNNGIKIINHSVGWFNKNFNDGQCFNDNPVCSVDDAYNNGILFVKSAGNYGERHYKATFSKSDPYCSQQCWHRVTPKLNASAGSTIYVFLTWDDWPTTNQDYDIYLFDDYLNIESGCSSEGQQSGSQSPAESFSCTANLGGDYYLYVVNTDTTSNHDFKIYSFYQDLNPNTPDESLSTPADAENAMAVAAIDWRKWETGPQESYSSQGPTSDGRTKPDITGPDGVSTYSYGQAYSSSDCESNNPTGFCGTSAAAPHVAGAAALLLSKKTYSLSGLWGTLTRSGIPDNIYGSGRLDITLHNLSVVKVGTGTGTVTNSDGSINCGSDCTESYPTSQSWSLTATPDSTSQFMGWSADCPSLTVGGLAGFGVGADMTATACFNLPKLTVGNAGRGLGTITSSDVRISCGSLECTADYNKGTTVILTATPASVSNFTGWSGACSGTGTCTVTINGDTSVTASYEWPKLTVTKTGPGSGTITSDPSGFSCGSTCSSSSGYFSKGTSVTLTATADSDWDFTGWSGSCSGSQSTCQLTMNADTSATAEFGCMSAPVRIPGKGFYSSIQAAYNAAAPGDIIQARAITFTENINTFRNILVTIDGGFDCHWTTNSGNAATLRGQLSATAGKVIFKNFALQN